jgi:hypothetical protein
MFARINHSETIRALAEITDAGLFERLATAVLRQAQPALYGNLSHPGMTSTGKTRRSPVDGIAFVMRASPPHMVATHHTSGPAEHLRKKWLNEPTRVKKRGPKPTAPAGDIIKTIAIVEKERKRTPTLRTTLALTTNQEPSEELIRDVESAANQHGITIDVWPGSRIAHYLDNTPDGQWFRYKYLGITQERISSDLLGALSRASLEAFTLMAPPDSLIERELNQVLEERSPRPLALLVGESGFGKTIACYRFLKNHIEKNCYGLVITHETLAAHATLDLAVDAELRKFHPSLEQHVGEKARALCSPDRPLLLIVEDVNKSDRPALMLERLMGWASRPTTGSVERVNWRVICPVWPNTVATASKQAKKRVDTLSVSVSRFSKSESRVAVKQRARLTRVTISNLEASRIAESLGNDPLLIGLYDFGGDRDPMKVIGAFVTDSLQRLSRSAGSLTLTEYQQAFQRVSEEMLVRRKIDPTWGNILEWLKGERDHLRALREIVRHGEIIRLGESGRVERLYFRHDRVQAWLLSETVDELMRNGQLQEGTSAEPFFAEVLGNALAYPNTPEAMVERLRRQNPLTLFYALKLFGEPKTHLHHEILKAVYAWLSEESTHERSSRSLRLAALQVLAETESSHVIPITDQFRDDAWSLVRARFRNGDVAAGIQLCLRVFPGMNAPWRDREIEHAKSSFGNTLTNELGSVLREPELAEGKRAGALGLAGYLAEPNLKGAIRRCWINDPARSKHLEEYLWAAAQCGGDDPSSLLRTICATWAKLPDEPPKSGLSSPRQRVGEDHLSWAFNEVLPQTSARYFVNRARRKDLRWPITLMLRGVNQPEGVEFIARVFASHGGSGGGFWPFPGTVHRDWERRQSELGKPMSVASRQRLLEVWKNEAHDRHLRRSAFQLWSATVEERDVALLRGIVNPGPLSDEILWAKMKRGDPTATPAFIDKLRGDHADYWWQLGRYTWSDALTTALGDELQRRADTVKREWDKNYRTDWIVSELVTTQLGSVTAEELLQEHWEHLHFSQYFILAALLVATPVTCALVAQAMHSCPDSRAMFEFAQIHFQPISSDGPGLERIEQAEAFRPYLDCLEPFAIFNLWETCNKLGWFTFRRQHLDARLDERFRERTMLDQSKFFDNLDDGIGRGGVDWADFMIDRYLQQTDRVEDIFELLEKWLKERRTIQAFDFVSAVLRNAGRRSHLQLLSIKGIEPAKDVEEIRADTLYAVSRHSLS